jgi:hypothetical protein
MSFELRFVPIREKTPMTESLPKTPTLHLRAVLEERRHRADDALDEKQTVDLLARGFDLMLHFELYWTQFKPLDGLAFQML